MFINYSNNFKNLLKFYEIYDILFKEGGGIVNYPKLKNALICRFIPYIVVLGGFIVPIVIVLALPFIPEIVKTIAVFGLVACLIIYIFKNFPVLMTMDVALATIHCINSARKRYDLPQRRTVNKIKKSISRFGKSYEPISVSPKPEALRYKFSSSATVYSKGIEKVIAVYNMDYLDKEAYSAIIRSGKANSNSLVGKKKQKILDSQQKKAPLHRVTVFIIFAKNIEEKLYSKLYETVSKDDGDENENSFIPCVINLQDKTCIFNSLTIPYVGFGYPVKNRGIKIVNKLVFGGNPPKNNRFLLEPSDNFDLEMSLWQFWTKMKKEIIDTDKDVKELYENMQHNEVIIKDEYLCLKWQDKGVMLFVEFDEESKKAIVDNVDYWDYPKVNPISKKTIAEIKVKIVEYFNDKGYSCEFISYEE